MPQSLIITRYDIRILIRVPEDGEQYVLHFLATFSVINLRYTNVYVYTRKMAMYLEAVN